MVTQNELNQRDAVAIASREYMVALREMGKKISKILPDQYFLTFIVTVQDIVERELFFSKIIFYVDHLHNKDEII